MSGFENGGGSIQVSIQPPDFTAALDTYNGMVADIGIEIKAKQQELSDLQDKITQTQLDLQTKYNTKVEDLGNKIKDLIYNSGELSIQIVGLEDEIKQRQQQRDAIILDFSEKQHDIEIQLAGIKKQSDDISDIQDRLDTETQELVSKQTVFAKEVSDFKVYKQDQTALLSQLTDTITKAQNKIEAVEKDQNLNVVILANKESDLADREKDLNIRLAAAQLILDQADNVAKQKSQNDSDAKSNTAIALQNQKDIEQIKVAQVVMNNKDQELKAREQMVSLAEKKIVK